MTVPRPTRPTPVAPAPQAARGAVKFGVSKGPCRKAWKLGIYAEHGVGKSTLASLCEGAIFADIEDSMVDLDVQRVTGIQSWSDLRAWVQQQTDAGTVRGIDTLTSGQDMCISHVIATKKQDGTAATTSLEDYKYKAGARYVYDEFRLLLGDIEASYRRGVSWIMIAHDFVEWFRNPDDKDYKRHAPDLIETKDYSIRLAWARFCDHLAFIDRDIVVQKGKASGGASRTIYMDGAPNRMCKMRGLAQDVYPWAQGDAGFWDLLRSE